MAGGMAFVFKKEQGNNGDVKADSNVKAERDVTADGNVKADGGKGPGAKL
jgi:hypothetical protein